MAIGTRREARPALADKHALAGILDDIEENLEVGLHPILTGPEVRQMMLDQGVRPEDCIASREILRARYPDDYED